MPLTEKEKAVVGAVVSGGSAFLAYYALSKLIPSKEEEPANPPPTEPAPPSPYPSIPALVISLGTVSLTTNVGAWVEGRPCIDQVVRVRYRTADWGSEGITKSTIYFQVLDSAGRGVPDVEVEMWSDAPTDKYFTTVELDGAPRTFEKPLVKRTDSRGVAWANISCSYGLDDGFETLCRDAGMWLRKWSCLIIYPGYVLTPRDGLQVCERYPIFIPYFVADKGGGGESQPVVRKVYCRVRGTALLTFETIACRFCARWL
jgi:hypothetical protein